MGSHHEGDVDLSLGQSAGHGVEAIKRLHCSLWVGQEAIIRKGLSHQPMDPVLINSDVIKTLDLSPLSPWIEAPLETTLRSGPVLELQFEWPRDPNDPRELAECPEPRLWALRADARCPWLPLILERDSGSLIRHVAMVVPHSFSQTEGLRFDPQALELWITHRMMLLDDLYSTEVGRSMRNNLSQVAASLGYELDHRFWDLLN